LKRVVFHSGKAFWILKKIKKKENVLNNVLIATEFLHNVVLTAFSAEYLWFRGFIGTEKPPDSLKIESLKSSLQIAS